MVPSFVSVCVRQCLEYAYRCPKVIWESGQIKFHEWPESSDCLFHIARILKRIKLAKRGVPEGNSKIDDFAVCAVQASRKKLVQSFQQSLIRG